MAKPPREDQAGGIKRDRPVEHERDKDSKDGGMDGAKQEAPART